MERYLEECVSDYLERERTVERGRSKREWFGLRKVAARQRGRDVPGSSKVSVGKS